MIVSKDYNLYFDDKEINGLKTLANDTIHLEFIGNTNEIELFEEKIVKGICEVKLKESNNIIFKEMVDFTNIHRETETVYHSGIYERNPKIIYRCKYTITYKKVKEKMKIDMKNQQRRTGKTSKLRQRILEDMMKCNYNKYVIIVHNRNTMKEYKDWYLDFVIIDKLNIFITYEPLDLENYLRGLTDHCVGVYVDEPYIIPKDKQSQFLKVLDITDIRNSVNVYGIGTRVEQPEQTFEDYLKD